jgi:hypothetical protein
MGAVARRLACHAPKRGMEGLDGVM